MNTAIIFAIIVIVFFIGLFEFLRLKQQSLYKSNMVKIKDLSEKLEILKALSFALSSKNDSLEKDLKELAASFFQQTQYIGCTISSGSQVFRFTPLPHSSNKDVDFPLSNQLTPLEQHLIAQDSETAAGQRLKSDYCNVILLRKLAKENNALLNDSERQHSCAILIPLRYQTENLGNIIFFHPTYEDLNQQERKLLLTTSYIITMLFRKFQINHTLSYDLQLKAVSIPW